jgi:hypothetical protein
MGLGVEPGSTLLSRGLAGVTEWCCCGGSPRALTSPILRREGGSVDRTGDDDVFRERHNQCSEGGRGEPTMKTPSARVSSSKAVGIVTRKAPSQGEAPSSGVDGDSAEPFDPAKDSAKDIFEGARVKQGEDYIRFGKPD